MTEPKALAATLDRWAFSGSTPEWDDVLRRAGVGSGRLKPRFAALALAGAILLAAPALALVSRVDLFGPGVKGRGIALSARLSGEGSASGRLELRLLNTLVTQEGPRGRLVPHSFRHVGSPRQPFTLRWQLRLTDGAADTAFIRREGRVLVQLCAPCPGATGSVQITMKAAAALLNNRTSADVQVGQGRLRGQIRHHSTRR